jgi:hypothetical protein
MEIFPDIEPVSKCHFESRSGSGARNLGFACSGDRELGLSPFVKGDGRGILGFSQTNEMEGFLEKLPGNPLTLPLSPSLGERAG